MRILFSGRYKKACLLLKYNIRADTIRSLILYWNIIQGTKEKIKKNNVFKISYLASCHALSTRSRRSHVFESLRFERNLEIYWNSWGERLNYGHGSKEGTWRSSGLKIRVILDWKNKSPNKILVPFGTTKIPGTEGKNVWFSDCVLLWTLVLVSVE